MKSFKRSILTTTAIPRPVKRLAPPAGVSVGDEFTVAGEEGRYRVGSVAPDRVGLKRA